MLPKLFYQLIKGRNNLISVSGSISAWLLAVPIFWPTRPKMKLSWPTKLPMEVTKNLLLPLLSARAGLCFGAEKQGLLPCCLGMRGIYCIYLPNMGLLGGRLTQNKKNGWSSTLPVEENGLNFISCKPASLTPDSAPACRFWTFPYESPPFHSCFKLWHEVV